MKWPEDFINQIICGDCIGVMKTMPNDSIDTIITDPPYNLTSTTRPRPDQSESGSYGKQVPFSRQQSRGGFMGKNWDGTGISFDIKLWKEILRIAKPGSTLLCFGGTRTYHRLACAIEDAGWILKDCIMWLYGCLSEDTEVLTKRGWEQLHKITKYDEIMVYDITKDIYKWETPKRWQVYRVNEDTAYRIKSDTTDQIVSKGHNCLIEREGKFVFKKAWELSSMERMPVLPQDFYKVEKGFGKVLLQELLWQGKGLAKRHSSFRQVGVDKKGDKKTERKNDGQKESCLERWDNLFQKERKLWQIQNKIYQMSQGIFGYGSKRWLCYGTQAISSSTNRQTAFEDRDSPSQRPQSRKQFIRQSTSFFKQQTPQVTRSKISKIKYSGLMFCPTVSTGAFVARRNGKVFITGNSGFPKATDISKQIDKKAGKKREVIGKSKDSTNRKKGGVFIGENEGERQITAPATPEATLWNGWKSHGLKPAYEPILVAMKPNEGSYANNALKWKVAGLNIDGGRISLNGDKPRKANKGKSSTNIYGWAKGGINKSGEMPVKGRYPANVILDEEAGRMLDEKSGELKPPWGKESESQKNTSWFSGKTDSYGKLYRDIGGASRFFYCAKASKAERNRGSVGLEAKFSPTMNDGIGCKEHNPETATKKQNSHPTVKPLALMKYLCIITKTPTGGIVLDPFCGSGTTLIACKELKRDYIGIDNQPEYCEIARKRVNATPELLF